MRGNKEIGLLIAVIPAGQDDNLLWHLSARLNRATSFSTHDPKRFAINRQIGFAKCWCMNDPGDRPAVFDESDVDREFICMADKLLSAVERIH